MIAYDTPLFREEDPGVETRVGLGVGYSQSQIDANAIGNGTSNLGFNSYQATAYISHERGPWFIQGDVSFGWNDYQGTRNISFQNFYKSTDSGFAGQNYTAFMSTGYHFLANDFTITPLASLQYTHVNVDGYSETNGGDVDLKINSQSYDFLESSLGAKAARPFLRGDKTYIPEVHARWLHELVNPTLQTTAAFTVAPSATFASPGFSPADDTFNVGAGLTLLSCSCSTNTWTLEAVYDYYWRNDNYSAQQGMLKFTSHF
jgi:outer membrane autotransporter protein